jgi:hypothetical protein
LCRLLALRRGLRGSCCLDFVVCPEEPALYFNEGVASGSRRVLFDRLAFLPRRMSYLPLPSSGRCLYLVLSCRFVSSPCYLTFLPHRFLSRFVSSLQCLVWIRLCLRQAAVLSRRFASSFCLVALSRCLPTSGRCFCLCQAIVLSRRFSVSLFGFSV